MAVMHAIEVADRDHAAAEVLADAVADRSGSILTEHDLVGNSCEDHHNVPAVSLALMRLMIQ